MKKIILSVVVCLLLLGCVLVYGQMEDSYIVGVRTVRTVNGIKYYSEINWSNVNGESTPNPFYLEYYQEYIIAWDPVDEWGDISYDVFLKKVNGIEMLIGNTYETEYVVMLDDIVPAPINLRMK